MKLGQIVEIPETSLGNSAVYKDLGSSDISRRVKIYLVPPEVSETKISIHAWDICNPERVPACRVKDMELVADYSLAADGDIQIRFLSEDLKQIKGDWS